MTEPSWPYPVTVTVGPDGHGTVRLSNGTDYLLPRSAVILYENPGPGLGARFLDWLRANPLKVQAALALLAGAVPETIRQLLIILL